MKTVMVSKKKELHNNVEVYLEGVLNDLKNKRVIKRN